MAKFRQPPNSAAEATIVSKNITANGTYNASADSADGYNPVTVAVPEKTIVSKSITANGTYNASSDSADGYNPVTVAVPIKTIVSKTITANGTYNASADSADGYDPVTVNVHIPALITGSSDPLNSQGNDGDTYIKCGNTTTLDLSVKALGGYNGGAHIICSCNGVDILHSIGTSPFNYDYDVKSASITLYGKTITVTITPPPTSTDNLIVTWAIDNTTVWTASIPSNGANSSYGYNTITDHNESISMTDDYVFDLWYKQNNSWLNNGSVINI